MLLWNGINKFWMHYNVEQILLLCIWTDIMDGCIWTPAATKVITFCVILAVVCLLLHCLDSARDNESFFGAEVSPGLKKKDRML